jgi:hypothetical protein
LGATFISSAAPNALMVLKRKVAPFLSGHKGYEAVKV